jgi:ribosomal protein S18 acetylase RimI-like enzyme
VSIEATIFPIDIHRLDDLVAVHQSAYKERPNLTYYLGEDFAKTTLQFFCLNQGGFGSIAYISNKPAGFVVGATFDPFKSLNSYRKKDVFKALLSKPALWFHPKVGGRIICRLLSGAKGDTDKFDLGIDDFGFVYSIAVTSDFAGRGLGRKLLTGFEAEARARNCGRVIIPVGEDNVASLRMVKRQGYELLSQELYDENLVFEKRL